MLVLSRKAGEAIHIGSDIVVTVVEVRGGRLRVGISCPRHVPIRRSELPAFNSVAEPEFGVAEAASCSAEFGAA
jgi:carbon storage regulator